MLDIPLSPSLNGLPPAERMAIVMRGRRAEGQPTTRDDFHQAEETCDLTDAQLDAAIGMAKRLINPETVRCDQPPRPVDPWDLDPDYRAERIVRGAQVLAPLLPMGNEGDMLVALRQARFSAREIGALWPDMVKEAKHCIDIRVAAIAALSRDDIRRAFA